MFALRAKATIAFPPSQTNRLAGVTTPSSAAAIETRSTLGNTASVVAPSRSRATRIGMFSKKRPVCFALPPRLRGRRGRSDRRPLNDSKMNVSSASTIPVSVLGLSKAGEPRNRCGQRNAVVGWTPQRSAAFSRLIPSSIAWAWSSHCSFLRSPATGVLVRAARAVCTPPAVEDAFAVLPQEMEIANPISFELKGRVHLPDSAAPPRSDFCTRRHATLPLNEPRSKLGSRKKEGPFTARQAKAFGSDRADIRTPRTSLARCNVRTGGQRELKDGAVGRIGARPQAS